MSIHDDLRCSGDAAGARPLAGRAFLVTGAAGGIGRAVADRLQADGASVLAVDREPDEGGPGVPFRADLLRREDNRAAVEVAVERFGRLDGIVANAGMQHVSPIAEFDEDRWDDLLALMLTSPFLLARYGWSALTAQPESRFIAVASAHALVASPFKSAYVAAKHGVLGLVRTMALEGADAGLSAVALCPGYVRTALVERQIADQARAHGIPETTVLDEVLLAPMAVKRLIEPEEVANTVAFLAGPGGSMFTGAPVPMDGGWTAR